MRSAYQISLCSLSLLLVAGCSDLNWPFHHPGAPEGSAPTEHSAGSDSASECADIQAQIRDSETARREAPATSTDADIVNAAQGKADKRIDDLRQRADNLDCPSEPATGDAIRVPPLQPAPGGGNK